MSQDQKTSLKATFVTDLFSNLVARSLSAQHIQLPKEQFDYALSKNIHDKMQEIKSDICSLDGSRFRQGYTQFINIINQSGSHFPEKPDEKSLTQLRSYIQEVPELMKIYDTVLLYRDFEYLINTINTMDFKPEAINKFATRVDIISPDLSEEDSASLKNGVAQLHNKYAEKLSQETSPAQSSDYQPLYEGYLNDYFYRQVAYQAENDGKIYTPAAIKAKATQLRKKTIQEIKDDFCSLIPLQSDKGYNKFIDLCGLSGIMQYIDASQQDDFIKQHIQNVPELNEIYQVWDLCADYATIADKTYKASSNEISYFEENVKSHENILSTNNIASLHYGIAALYDKYMSDNSDKLNSDGIEKNKKNSFSHLLIALKLTDNPQTINECMRVAPYSHNINIEVEKACHRALTKRGLSNHTKYNLYRILYNTHLREHKKIGFVFGPDAKKIASHEKEAAKYYTEAKKYARGSDTVELDIPLIKESKRNYYH